MVDISFAFATCIQPKSLAVFRTREPNLTPALLADVRRRPYTMRQTSGEIDG